MSQIVSFSISIILARILGPEQFGLIGMALVVISISQVFGEIGLSAGIIQAKETNQTQLSTIFFINLFLGVFLFLVIYLTSPLIADFFNESRIDFLLKMLSFLFIIRAISIVPKTLLKKEVNFKSLSILNFISISISGLLGALLAYYDFRVMALVYMHLAEALIASLLIWSFIKWKPSLRLKINSIMNIWKFSSNLFIANMLDTVFNRIDIVVIGKIFTPTTLGFYTRATSFYSLIIRYTSDSFSQVIFPTVSRLQNNIEEVSTLIRKSYHLISLLIFYLIGLLYLNSDAIIITLLTEKWLQTSEYFKILSLSAFAYPLSVTMMNILSGLGYSKLFLRLEIIKKVLLLLTYVIGFSFGIIGFLYGLIVNRFISTLINLYYGGKKINIPLQTFLAISSQYLLIALISYLICFNVSTLIISTTPILALIINALTYSIMFLIGLVLFKSEGLLLLLKQLRKTRKND